VTPPRLAIKVTGPRTQSAGAIAEYFVELTNAGAATANEVVVDVQYGINLRLEAASGKFEEEPQRRTMHWRIGTVAGGATVRKQLNCRCLNPDEAPATVRATVTSSETRATPQSAEARTVIIPGSAPPPVGPTTRPPVAPAGEGDLVVTIRELADPIMVGGKTTYIIEIKNDRKVSDQDVTLSVRLPDGLKIINSRGPTALSGVAELGRVAEMTPVTEIRAAETLAAYQVEVSGEKSGKYRVQATVTSTRSPAGVTAEAETTVNAP
jgi:hypothetical protein